MKSFVPFSLLILSLAGSPVSCMEKEDQHNPQENNHSQDDHHTMLHYLKKMPDDIKKTIFSLLLTLQKDTLNYNYQLVHNQYCTFAHNDLNLLLSLTTVASSPDGATIATGTDRFGQIIVLDAKTHQKFKEFEGHKGPITSLAYSPNGKTILSGSEDKTARLWNIETEKEIFLFKSPTQSRIPSVAISPDGKYALIASRDIAYLLNLTSGEEIHKIAMPAFNDSDTTIFSVAFSPDGKTFLTGTDDRVARLWNTEKGILLKEFVGRHFLVSSVAFSADGLYIFTGSYDFTVRMWNSETTEELKTFEKAPYSISSIAVGPYGNTVIACLGGIAILYDVATGKELMKFTPSIRGKILSVAGNFKNEPVLVFGYDSQTLQFLKLCETPDVLTTRSKAATDICMKFYPLFYLQHKEQ